MPERQSERESGAAVAFVTNEANVANLGDRLCSPRHYFRFVPPAGRKVVIIGGGAFSDFALARASKIDADIRILWGVGRSLKEGKPSAELDLDELSRVYALCSTRDPEWAVGGVRLVPCSSVFHAICDVSPGEQTGLFLNGNPKTSGANFLQMLSQFSERVPNLVVGTNSMPLAEFMRAFAMTKRLITNSYHVAYWGLLSGRAVRLIGYSSKFTSLFTLFEIKAGNVLPYKKGAGDQLAEAIEQSLVGSSGLLLDDAAACKQRFRELNRQFARELVTRGCFDSVALREGIG